MKFKLHLYKPSFSEFRPGYSEYCSFEPLMLFLHNSPILKVLTISYDVGPYFEDLPLSWNQQSSVPGCLLSHLEIFVWDKFGGRRRQERECVEYILANSKCLKTATVLPRCSYRLKEKEKMAEDIKSMYRGFSIISAGDPFRFYKSWKGNKLKNIILLLLTFWYERTWLM